jgi:CTP:molybdopterin cytidylyltransferase MocA
MLCSKFILEKIINNDEDFNAKKITEENEDKILYVPVKSNGIILDFDTKDDFISS